MAVQVVLSQCYRQRSHSQTKWVETETKESDLHIKSYFSFITLPNSLLFDTALPEAGTINTYTHGSGFTFTSR